MQNTSEKEREPVPEPQDNIQGQAAGSGGTQAYYGEEYHSRRGKHRAYYPHDPRHKSTLIAVLLSCMPGLGQIYIGYYQQGFINIAVVASLIALLSAGLGKLAPLAGLFLAFFWLYNIVDAYRRAALYNQAVTGLGPEELPEDIKLPRGKGSIFGGSILIVFGGLALAHTRWGYSMEWVEEWWPLALVLIGAYLILQHFMNKKE
jgi:hypothetical protein